jgi:hypothetical protein
LHGELQLLRHGIRHTRKHYIYQRRSAGKLHNHGGHVERLHAGDVYNKRRGDGGNGWYTEYQSW